MSKTKQHARLLADGEALLLVYYHDDQMLTQECKYD